MYGFRLLLHSICTPLATRPLNVSEKSGFPIVAIFALEINLSFVFPLVCNLQNVHEAHLRLYCLLYMMPSAQFHAHSQAAHIGATWPYEISPIFCLPTHTTLIFRAVSHSAYTNKWQIPIFPNTIQSSSHSSPHSPLPSPSLFAAKTWPTQIYLFLYFISRFLLLFSSSVSRPFLWVRVYIFHLVCVSVRSVRRRHPSNRYYSDRGTCEKCYLSCATCSGPRRDQCVTCPKNWQLASGECSPECPEGFFKSEFGCQKCHHYCKTCSG